MNRVLLALTSAAALALPAFSQQMSMPMPAPAATTGPASEVLSTYNRVKENVIKAAEKMPAANYDFKPTPDIRTYARVVNHVTEAQFHTCTTLNGGKFDPASVPTEAVGKDAIVAGLKASFAECDKAYSALTDTNVAEMLPQGKGKRSRIGMAWGNVSHDNEQYAELSTYLRLKNIAPPTSEK